jgi:hypothetical protein
MTAERFPIDESHVLMFARAIGDPNPAFRWPREHSSGPAVITVPPTFVQASAHFDPDYRLRPRDGEPWSGSGAGPTGTPDSGSKSSSELSSGLHAEQRFEYHRILGVGDVLSATTRAGKSWTKTGRRGGTLTFNESVTEYRDSSGDLVVTATSVVVRTEKVPLEQR